MKQLKTQKWLLSTFLIAALGSQYYFSVSSQDTFELPMSSTAAEAPVKDGDLAVITTILGALSGNPPAASVPLAAPAPAAAAPSPAPQAQAGTIQQASCEGCVTLSKMQAEALKAYLEAAKKTAEAKKDESLLVKKIRVVVGKSVEEEEVDLEDCAEFEKVAEKRKCDKKNKDLVKSRTEELRKKAEKAELDARHEAFEADIQKAADNCSDAKCAAEAYTRALRKYTGKKKIDYVKAENAYKKLVEPKLKSLMLTAEDSSGVDEALRELGRDIPSEYKGIQKLMVGTVKAAAEDRATSIKQLFKDSQTEKSRNNTAESLRLFDEALVGGRNFEKLIYGTNSDNGVINTFKSTYSGVDSELWNYVQSNFSGPVRKLFIELATGQAGASTRTNNNADGTSSNRGTVRGGNGVEDRGGRLPGRGDANTGSTSTLPTENNGILLGTPRSGAQGFRTGTAR